MKPHHILQGLENLIQSLSIDLRYEKGDFAGGLCRLPDKSVFIINPKLPVETKIKLIASELRLLELNHIYIRPALRQVIYDEFEV
ncbi:MAG: hypothetical protein ONB31_09080 [candidate division KSB1 bacterium]|nr:hypothetical protein [candidate division KSB1 bacterium]MDZ7333675.1 hypothetical protein [candidate division KSB1 bacterium]MDZ7356123.1 hypothetical protein [candidate division KSB1 bacterium]MDZ7398900.1 hypothetical protein [candidate division KSB1 bacterium]